MPNTPCSECTALRAELAAQKAQFDASWSELQAERDFLREAIEAFQVADEMRGAVSKE